MVQSTENMHNSTSRGTNLWICKHHKCFLHWFLVCFRSVSRLRLSVMNAIVPIYVQWYSASGTILLRKRSEAVVLRCVVRKSFLAGLAVQEKSCWRTRLFFCLFVWEMMSTSYCLYSLTSRISHNWVQKSGWPKNKEGHIAINRQTDRQVDK